MEYVSAYPALSVNGNAPTPIGSVTTNAHNYESYAHTSATKAVYTFRNVRVGTVNMDLSKVWNDDGYHESVNQEVTLEIKRKLIHENIEFDTFEHAQFVELDGSESTPWTARVEDLPKYDEDGVPYYYAVREVKVTETSGTGTGTVLPVTDDHYTLSDGQQYAVTIAEERQYGEHSGKALPEPDEYEIDVKNARAATKSVVAYKVWKDVMREDASGPINANEYQNRPDIYFELYQSINGGEIEPVKSRSEVLWSTTGEYGTYYWKGEFQNLPRYTDDGEEIEYYVREGKTAMGEYVVEYYDMKPEKVSGAPVNQLTNKDVYKENAAATPLWASDSGEDESYVPEGGTIVNVRKERRYLTGRKIWKNMPDGYDAEYFPEVTFRLHIYVDSANGYEPFTAGTATFGLEGELTEDKAYFVFEEYDSGSGTVNYLEKYDEYGVFIRYRAQEFFGDPIDGIEQPPGYLPPVYDDYEMAVENSYDVDQASRVKVKVEKIWDASLFGALSADEYPTANLELWRVMTDKNGNDLPATAKHVEGNVWEVTYPDGSAGKTFTNLIKYGYNGYEYRYFLKEQSLNGYTVTGLGVDDPDEDLDNNPDIFEYEVTNEYTGIDKEYIKLHGTKYWVDSSDKFDFRPTNLALKVYRQVEGGGTPVALTSAEVEITWSKTSDNWTYLITAKGTKTGTTNPDPGTEEYTLYRYAPNGKPYIYYVAEEKPDYHYMAANAKGTDVSTESWAASGDLTLRGGSPINNAIEVSFRNTLETTDVSVEKRWMKAEGSTEVAMDPSEFAMMLPDSVTFTVERWNGLDWETMMDKSPAPVTTTVNKADFIAAMTGGNTMLVKLSDMLPKYSATHIEEKYRLVETEIGGNTIAVNKAGGFIVDNNDAGENTPMAAHTVTNKLETNKLIIKKAFEDEDNQDGIRPEEIEFTIERDGDSAQTITAELIGGTDLTAWEKWLSEGVTVYVPKYQANGSAKSTYAVTEEEINKYTLKDPSAPAYPWTKAVPYDTDGDGTMTYLFENQHAAGEMNVTVTKEWLDTAASIVGGVSKTRPDSITVTLQRRLFGSTDDADWKPVLNWEYETVEYEAEVTLEPTTSGDVGGAWESHTWEGLPCRTNDDTGASMKIYEYRVVETGVTGYTTTYSPPSLKDEGGTIKVTNTLELTELPVKKVWSPPTNEFAAKPEVEVQLMYSLDGDTWFDTTQTLDLDKDNNWQKSFTDLPMKDKYGTPYQYTVKETKIGGVAVTTDPQYSYTSAVSLDSDGATVTNTLVTRGTGITVSKIWEDEENQDGIRTNSVNVRLVKDKGTAEEVESAYVALTAPDWIYTWSDLPRYQSDGTTECVYTVEEEPITGYTTSYSVDNGATWITTNPHSGDMPQNKVIVKNSYTPKTMKLTVTKKWEDQADRFDLQPSTVKVRLMSTTASDGITGAVQVASTSIEVLNATDWSHTWDNLPVMRDGERIYYSVQELKANGSFEAKPIPAYKAPVYDYEASTSSGGTVMVNNDGEVSVGGSIDDPDATEHRVTITNALDDVKVTVNKVWDDHDNYMTQGRIHSPLPCKEG